MSRICDRAGCGGRVIKEKLKSAIDGSEIDLCTACEEDFRKWLNHVDEPKRTAGRPPKEK